MTKKLYLSDASTTCEAVVTACIPAGRNVVRLSCTVFHPQGGGQRADAGTIGAARVVDVRHAPDGEVDHIVEDFAGLEPGQPVRVVVDERLRRLHARLHTAGHLIADVATGIDRRLTVKAGHHWPGEARVEFEGPIDDADAFAVELQSSLDALIAANVRVTAGGDPLLTRTIRIGNNTPVGCGGTHVASLGEIEKVIVRRLQHKKGVLRVSYDVSET